MHEGLQKVFDAIPLKCNKIFIAGGAAHNFELAEDVDLWIPNGAVQAAVDILNTIEFPKVSFFKDSKSVKYADGETKQFQLIGEFYFAPVKKTVQILVTDQPTIAKTIARFDLSIHALGVTRNGAVVQSPYWAGNYIDIMSPTPNTLKRYIKFCNRYGLKVDSYTLKAYYSDNAQIEYTPPDEDEAEKPASLEQLAAKLYGTEGAYSYKPIQSAVSTSGWLTLGPLDESVSVPNQVIMIDTGAIEKKIAEKCSMTYSPWDSEEKKPK